MDALQGILLSLVIQLCVVDERSSWDICLTGWYLSICFLFQLTMADIAVYEDLTSVLQKDTNLLDKYPKMTAHRQRIAGLPRIKEYLVYMYMYM
jgi:hypothetical protein